MSTPTYTAAGVKATATAKLDKGVFGLEVKNHDLLKQAYIATLANKRSAAAKTKKRGEVRGGGIKPWAQKGTGRARVGSSRSPIWRSGGITFGPTGDQNYKHYLTPTSKRLAVRQALSLASDSNKVIVISDFESKEGKVSEAAKLLIKIGAEGNVLLVVPEKSDLIVRATRNISGLKLASSNYLTVNSILDADVVVISESSLPMITEWLGAKVKTKETTK